MIYLASSSPRRAELLRQINVKFDIIKADIDESGMPGETVEHLVTRLSRDKAQEGQKQIKNAQSDDLVIASDTLISLDGQVIGKPRSEMDCRDILSRLSGRAHEVFSAVSVMSRQQIRSLSTINEISFRELTEPEIEAYCAGEEPHDKAGAYAIQGLAAQFIKNLNGSYSAVMGLPLYETAQLLKKFNYPVLGNVITHDT